MMVNGLATGERLERGLAYLSLLAATLTIVVSGLVLRNTYYGDSTIYLVYARNIAAGDFFSFNPGEFSSGSTSPLWALLLAPGFLGPHGPETAKAMGLLMTVLAVCVAFFVISSITQSWMGGAVATVLVARYVTLPGLLFYESPLIVIVVLLAIGLTPLLLREGISRRLALLLTFVWCCIPLSRPDAAVVLLIHFFVLAFFFFQHQQRDQIVKLAALLLIACVPTVLYFAYSSVTLGVFSTSSISRSYALRELASQVFGVQFSVEVVRFFLSRLVFLGLLLAIWGQLRLRRRSDTTVAWFAIFCIVAYILLFTFVSPATFDVDRYLLPPLVFLAVLVSPAVADIYRAAQVQRATTFILLSCALVVLTPLRFVLGQANFHAARGLTLETIAEKGIIDFLNTHAPDESVVLAYEVQDRFFLRPDLSVLSLDGITDGKVLPYMESGDMLAFLNNYRPDYWLANEAVFRREYLSGTVLHEVGEQNDANEGDVLEAEGIRFTVLKRNTSQTIPGFDSYKRLYRLEYE